MDKLIITKDDYQKLIDSIGILLQHARQKAFEQVNRILVQTYWEIGKHIVVYEQENKARADYGSHLLDVLSKDLKDRYGKGFSRRNVLNMRNFYLSYQKWQAVPAILSWSHIVSLLSVEDDLARSFYEKECIANKWSTRELDRQINSMLFERLALSKDKKGVLKLALKGHKIERAEDVVKNPYILEFLGIPEDYRYSEKELEQKIIDNMQNFLLELGKGFSFIGRQYRITLNNKHFYIDLVFYHRILKCFVLVDLLCGAPHKSSCVALPVMWRSACKNILCRKLYYNSEEIESHIINRIRELVKNSSNSDRLAGEPFSLFDTLRREQGLSLSFRDRFQHKCWLC